MYYGLFSLLYVYKSELRCCLCMFIYIFVYSNIVYMYIHLYSVYIVISMCMFEYLLLLLCVLVGSPCFLFFFAVRCVQDGPLIIFIFSCNPIFLTR